jgi:hypothetical protein
MFELAIFYCLNTCRKLEKSFLVRGPLLVGGLDYGLMGPPKSGSVSRHKLIMHLTLDGLVSYWMANSQS